MLKRENPIGKKMSAERHPLVLNERRGIRHTTGQTETDLKRLYTHVQ